MIEKIKKENYQKMNHTVNTKPVLSISLMSNGKKNTVRRCLDSLAPVMEAVPSELIIVDTGCDEATASIIREYTENIVPFTWCNDFSKARNAGLKRACGEWFMYLDDDEWFEDASQLISFFTSGEYKKYAGACYIVRNYADYEETAWEDVWVSRLIRLDKDTHFESSIHEYLYPVKGVSKLIHSYVKHFGYIFDSEEEKAAHAHRNITLLSEMVKKEPDNIRWWVHLAQEYRVINDMEKLETLCRDALQQFKATDAYNINNFRGTFYVGLLMKYITQHEYKKALVQFKDAIADRRNTDICKAMLYARAAELYYTLGQYEECGYCCKEYMKRYDALHMNEEECYMQGSIFTHETCKKEIRNNVYSFFIKCCVLKGDRDGFITYFYKIGWKEDMIHIYYSLIGDVLEGMAILPYTDKFVDMAQTMMERRGINQLTVEKLKELEKTAPQQFEALFNIFSKTNPPVLYRETKPEQPVVSPEMQQLATQIKEQIQLLISQGLYAEANGILAQLKTFVPMDEELVQLERMIKK